MNKNNDWTPAKQIYCEEFNWTDEDWEQAELDFEAAELEAQEEDMRRSYNDR